MDKIIKLEYANDFRIYGNKAVRLAELMNKGITVPNGIVITVECFYEYIMYNEINFDTINWNSYEDDEGYSKLIDVLTYGKWSKELYNELKHSFSMIEHPVCVRSSGIKEDSKDGSMAGHYISYINIRNFSEYLNAIRECWKSAFHPSIIKHMSELNLKCQPIPLLIQSFKPSVCSGVAFYTKEKIIVSATYGLCVGVVSGNIACDEYEYNKNSRQWSKHIVYKDKCYLPFSYEQNGYFYDSQNITIKWKKGLYQQFEQISNNSEFSVCLCSIRKNPPEDIRNIATLSDDELEKLMTVLNMAAKQLDFSNVDFEWSLDSEGVFHILQARSFFMEEFELRPKKGLSSYGNDVFQGVAISPGVYEGRVVFYRSEEDKGRINQGDIVIMRVIPDDFIDILSKVGAIVLKSDVLLSHCAIIAREWGKPCVGGMMLENFSEGNIYKVDGNTGSVKMIGNSK